MYVVVERSGLPIGSTTISNSFVLSKTFSYVRDSNSSLIPW